MESEYITSYLWEKVEADKSKKKIAQRVFNVLNYDVLSVVGMPEQTPKTFWFEKTYSEAKIPEYVYQYAKRVYQKLGYTYLYDIKTN